MHIIAIAWIYVTFLMALTETSVTAGVLTFVSYGLAPLALFVYVFGRPRRKAQRPSADGAYERPDQPDRKDAKPDE